MLSPTKLCALSRVAPLVSHLSPYDTAKEYLRRNCFREGFLASYFFWQDQFWEWNGRYYEVLSTEILRDRLYAFLDGSQKLTGGFETTRFKPTPRHVNEVLDGLKSGLVLGDEWQPMWFETGKRASNVLAFRNTLINVLTGEPLKLTPRLWIHSAVDYDWDPEAKCPEWERFLAEVFPDERKPGLYRRAAWLWDDGRDEVSEGGVVGWTKAKREGNCRVCAEKTSWRLRLCRLEF